MKRLIPLFLTCLFFVTTTAAQLCTFGVHGTPAPEGPNDAKSLTVSKFEVTPIYLIIFSEAVVEGASFAVKVTPYSPTADFVLNPLGFGPYGDAFNLTSPGGFNVGFGECIWGFDGIPVGVMQFELLLLDPGVQSSSEKVPTAFMEMEVVNNPDENPDYPVFAGCSGAGFRVKYIAECTEPAAPLTLYSNVVPTASTSWGALKSLY